MTVELSFPVESDTLRRARNEARAAAAGLGATERVCDTVALVVDELVNNAVEHGTGYRRGTAPLQVRLEPVPRGVALEFLDPEMPDGAVAELAEALGKAGDGTPALDNERGRGLFLMSVYVDSLRVGRAGTGGLSLRGVIAEGAA